MCDVECWLYLVLGLEMGDGVAALDLDLGAVLAADTQQCADDSVLTSIATQVMIQDAEEDQGVDRGGEGAGLGQGGDGGGGTGDSVHGRESQMQC